MPDKIIIETKCTCPCHSNNSETVVMHFRACCEEGISRQIITNPKVVAQIIEFIQTLPKQKF